MKCQFCDKKATHLNPVTVCDFHYVETYSYQMIEGERVPFKKVLKQQLEKIGMWKEEDETLEKWYERCKDYFHDRTRKH